MWTADKLAYRNRDDYMVWALDLTPASNEIFYTTTTGNIISQLNDDTGFGVNLVSNTVHSSGKYCVLTFDGVLTKSGDHAFKDKGSLTAVYFPSTVTSISVQCFHGATNLAYVKMSPNVTRINAYAFKECSSLNYIDIPEGCTALGGPARILGVVGNMGQCFESCTSLRSVTIPSSVTVLHIGVFRYCSNLSEVIVNAVTPPEMKKKEDATYYTQFTSCSSNLRIKVPAASLQDYLDAPGWSQYASKIVAQ